METLLRNRKTTIIFALVIIIGVTVFALANRSDSIRVYLEAEKLWIDGPNELQYSIPLGSIQEVSLVNDPVYDETIPVINKIVCGQYVNDQWGGYSLCASIQIPACVVVNSKEGTYVFNYGDLDTTQWFYDEFVEYLKEYNT